MVFAIEPMVTMGQPAVRVLGDNWTAVTRDGSLAAHFEHTVVVSEVGPEVLTQIAESDTTVAVGTVDDAPVGELASPSRG